VENKNLIIAVIVGIIVLKLLAAHLYLKKKFKESEDNSSTENKKDEQ